MEDRLETGWLLDFYGPMLTDRQREILSLWCEDDLSLSEIASQEGISRQGAYDTFRTAEQRLRELEERLGLLSRYRRLTEGLGTCLEEVRAIPGEKARRAEALLSRLLAEEEEENGL